MGCSNRANLALDARRAQDRNYGQQRGRGRNGLRVAVGGRYPLYAADEQREHTARTAAPLDVYVEEQHYDRALEVLNAAVPSDEELARLSHEAGEESAP
jgi:hypothetical protein